MSPTSGSLGGTDLQLTSVSLAVGGLQLYSKYCRSVLVSEVSEHCRKLNGLIILTLLLVQLVFKCANIFTKRSAIC